MGDHFRLSEELAPSLSNVHLNATSGSPKGATMARDGANLLSDLHVPLSVAHGAQRVDHAALVVRSRTSCDHVPT